jgi:putative phage-type endonuclease
MLSREQMELRRSGVTASEIAAVAGLNPWQTPLQAWARKLGLEPEPETTEAMARGNYLEPALLRWAGDLTGLVIGPAGTVVLDKLGSPNVIATPDGYGYHESTIDPPSHVIEVKAPGSTWADWTDPAVDPQGAPIYYLAQVQWQMLATGIKGAILAGLIRGRLWVYHVEAHQGLQDQLLHMARLWWQNVVKRTPPAPSAPADARALAGIIRQTTDEILKIEGAQADEVASMLREYQAAQDRAKLATAELDTIKGRILYLVGERAGLEAADMSCTWKAAKAAKITDWRAVAEAAGAEQTDIDQHTTERAGSRRLYVRERKAG